MNWAYRFWMKVQRSGECWVWGGATAGLDGYGAFFKDGRMQRAHRVAWEDAFGKIPGGLRVLHRCDNPPCVRPAHLFLGTQSDNMQDMVRKGRNKAPRHQGSKNPQAKLNEDAVRAIRKSRRRGIDLARHYGVSEATISETRSGKMWAHVRCQR